MKESLGPEWRDLLIKTYMTCTIDEFDDLWHDAVKELTLMSMMESEDSDSDEEEELQDALLLRTLLPEEEASLQYAQFKDRRAALFFNIINCEERVLHPYMSSRRSGRRLRSWEDVNAFFSYDTIKFLRFSVAELRFLFIQLQGPSAP